MGSQATVFIDCGGFKIGLPYTFTPGSKAEGSHRIELGTQGMCIDTVIGGVKRT